MHTLQAQTYIGNSHTIERKIVFALLAAIGVTLALYMYFIGHVVFAVLAERHYAKDISSNLGNVATLEAQYLAKTESLSLSLASTVGLTEPKDIAYASRVAAASGFAFNTTRQFGVLGR